MDAEGYVELGAIAKFRRVARLNVADNMVREEKHFVTLQKFNHSD